VITGALNEVKRMETPVPVEVSCPTFFKKIQRPIYSTLCKTSTGCGPNPSLYGGEAVSRLIKIITKQHQHTIVASLFKIV
jgi:hypothetical protein